MLFRSFQDGVELPGRVELVEAPQAMEHSLDQSAMDALVFDQEQVGAIAVGLCADEHGRCVSSDITSLTTNCN